eukprot:gene27925-34711_t
MNCALLRDALVMDIAMPHSLDLLISRRSTNNAIASIRSSLLVALFDCSLEISGATDGRSVEMEIGTDRETDGISVENMLLSRFAQSLQMSGVELVCCQQRVHPHLLRELTRLSIVCLPRVSGRFMGALQRLSGARTLGAIPLLQGPRSQGSISGPFVLERSSFGVLSSVRKEFLCSKPFVVARGVSCEGDSSVGDDRDRTVLFERLRRHDFSSVQIDQLAARMSSYSSVVVTAESASLCSQLQTAIEDSLHSLWRLLRSPYVSPGGGCWQAALACGVTDWAAGHLADVATPSRSQRLVQQAVLLYGECLQRTADTINGHSEDCGKTFQFARNDLSPSKQFESEEEEKEQEEEEVIEWEFTNPSGVSVLCRSEVTALDRDVFHFISGASVCEFEGCLQALDGATQLAITLLDIDEQIQVAPEERNV